MEPWAIALLGGGLLAGLAALAAVPGRIFADLRAQLAHERDGRLRAESDLAALRVDHDALVSAVSELRAELASMREREAGRDSARRAESAPPALAVWDFAACGYVLSSSLDGGTWLWVNQPFARALGYPREEVLKRGWRAFVDPDTLPRVEAVESSAHYRSVRRFVTRYCRADGGWVLATWYCSPYDEQGHARCVVRLVREEELGDEDVAHGGPR